MTSGQAVRVRMLTARSEIGPYPRSGNPNPSSFSIPPSALAQRLLRASVARVWRVHRAELLSTLAQDWRSGVSYCDAGLAPAPPPSAFSISPYRSPRCTSLWRALGTTAMARGVVACVRDCCDRGSTRSRFTPLATLLGTRCYPKMNLWSFLAGLLFGTAFVLLGVLLYALRQEKIRSGRVTWKRLVIAIAPTPALFFAPLLWIVVNQHGVDLSSVAGAFLGALLLSVVLYVWARARKTTA